MKKIFIYSLMMVCLTVLGFLFISCLTLSNASTSDNTTELVTFPAELQRKWDQVGGMTSTSTLEIDAATLVFTINRYNPIDDSEETISYTFTITGIELIDETYLATGIISSSNHFRLTDGYSATFKLIPQHDNEYLGFYDSLDEEAFGVMFN